MTTVVEKPQRKMRLYSIKDGTSCDGCESFATRRLVVGTRRMRFCDVCAWDVANVIGEKF